MKYFDTDAALGSFKGSILDPLARIGSAAQQGFELAKQGLEGASHNQPVMAAGIPQSAQVGQSRITPQPVNPQPTADGITHLSTSVVTPTPLPGEDAWVADMRKKDTSKPVDYWKDLYKKATLGKGSSGNFYKGAQDPVQAVMGTATIDPKTLPTYNNPTELERAKPFVQTIAQSAKKYGLPPEVLAAALWRESAGFDPKFVNGMHMDGTGRGIAGIDAVQRKDVPDDVAFNPAKAIDWMAQTLKAYQDQEGGNLYNALRRYNGGPNYNDNRIGYNGQPVSELTKRHADYIRANAENLRTLFGN